jgi:hypothetical protein
MSAIAGAKRRKFLDALRQCGNVTAACRAAQLDQSNAYKVRAADPEFAAAWADALEEAADVLEAEAWRRAVRGVERPVFQGGEQVGAVREYSDTLLIFLLKGAKPEKYRDNYTRVHAVHEHSGPAGAPLPIAVFNAQAALAIVTGGAAGLAGQFDDREVQA